MVVQPIPLIWVIVCEIGNKIQHLKYGSEARSSTEKNDFLDQSNKLYIIMDIALHKLNNKDYRSAGFSSGFDLKEHLW